MSAGATVSEAVRVLRICPSPGSQNLATSFFVVWKILGPGGNLQLLFLLNGHVKWPSKFSCSHPQMNAALREAYCAAGG